MTPFDLEQLRPGGQDCPSDVTLWRLHGGELSGELLQTTQRHVDGCQKCAARLAQRQAGFDAYPEVDPRKLLAAIRRQGEERTPGFLERWSRSLKFVLAPLVLAGTGALFLASHPHGGDGGGGPQVVTTRAKGGAILHVFRQLDGAVREAISGDHFKSGDRLQFAVDLDAERRIQIVGVEASGKLYPVWPLSEGPVKLAPGKGQSIPSAVELDETTGTETLYLVACPPAELDAACTSRGPAEAPACKPGCATTPFVLHKGQ